MSTTSPQHPPPNTIPSPTKTVHNDSYPSIKPTRPELSTKGKSIFITGGSGGIGKYIADGFAQSGATAIALLGRTESALASAQKDLSSAYPATKTYAYQADITDLASVSAAFEKFAAAVDSGKIDVLVSNVGYGPDWTSIEKSGPDDWWKAYEVNVRGTYNALKAFAPVAAKYATAINVTSASAGLYVPGASGYATAKLAACKMFEYFMHENPGLTAISFHPGVIKGTVSSDKAIASSGAVLEGDSPELPKGFAVWLASPEAKFLSGKMVWAAWDVDELKANAAQIQNSMMFSLGHKGFPDIVPFEN